MSEATLSSMPDARDAEDTRLLEEGNLAALMAKYQPVILGRCIARLQGDEEAEDVAQNVMLRLVAEFERGKRYSVPYRVVVHQVTTWTLAEYFEGKPTDLPLPEGWEPAAPDFTEEVEQRDYLSSLFGAVGQKTRQVLELRYLLGLEIDQALRQALRRSHSPGAPALEDAACRHRRLNDESRGNAASGVIDDDGRRALPNMFVHTEMAGLGLR